MSAYFDAPEKLQVLPTLRAAYSDRTAWMMCEMSALAYLRYEGENRFQGIFAALSGIAKVAKLRKDGDELAKQMDGLRDDLKRYIAEQLKSDNSGAESEPAELTELKSALGAAGFDLVRCFNEGDTQAFLAKREKDKTAVLAFRGTEANSWTDVKTDLNARFYKGEGGVKMHSGFVNAYKQVREQVRKAVDKLPPEFSLYITGHSLGGALATIAARDLERDSLAACYTFGGPRVGDEEFADDIRAPVYRVVNAADGVPRVPPSWLTYVIVFVVSFVRKDWADALEKRFCGYKHVGDMRYLTACPPDNMESLKVMPNLAMPFRVWRLGKRIATKGLSVAGKDHGVAEYRRKLKFHAKRRAAGS